MRIIPNTYRRFVGGLMADVLLKPSGSKQYYKKVYILHCDLFAFLQSFQAQIYRLQHNSFRDFA